MLLTLLLTLVMLAISALAVGMALTEQRGIDIGLYADVSGTPTLVGALRSVDLTMNGESIDASHAGNFGWRKKLVGLIDWSASASHVLLMDLAAGGFDPAYAALRTAFSSRVSIPVEIRYPDTSTDAGNAIITSLQISGPYDDVAEGTINLEGDGALTFTQYTP